MSNLKGPCKIPCPGNCDVPEGAVIAEVPPPRHNWPDVMHCQHGDVDCDRWFLIVERP